MPKANTIPEEFRSPFGGIDEQAVTEALEEMVGISGSFALMRLWQNCHMSTRGRGESGAPFTETRSRREVAEASFRNAAKRDGYSIEVVEHYLTYIV